MPYVAQGKHEEKRETILVEHLWELPLIPSSEGIRSNKWKYFRYRFIDTPEVPAYHYIPCYFKELKTKPGQLDLSIERKTKSRVILRFTAS